MRQPPPDSDPQTPTPEPSIQQQANNSTMGAGMQAAQGNNNIQNQGNNNWLGNIINIFLNHQTSAPVGNPARPENQRQLLAEVKREVTGRLKSSLHNAVLINLSKQVQPEQVKRSWDVEIKIGSKPSELLPPQTSIKQVFDRTDIAGKLLILGEPGAGKTTTMLELAQELVQKAEAQATYPVPVLLNLSSWKNPRQPMKDWLVEELKSKYGVRKDIGKSWLEEKQLLPLLDGLDEVKPEHQVSCVKVINQWLQSEFRPQNIVVCSRREEYEKVVRGRWQEAETLEEEVDDPQEETHLNLNGAILLQALTDEQIQQYLTSVNCTQLWQVLQNDAVISNPNAFDKKPKNLLELVRTPLLLSITILSYEELSLEQWQQLIPPEQRLERLLDAYVQRMLRREIQSKVYGKHKVPRTNQTQQWLMYLAQQMQRKSTTEFLIEEIQPSWLITKSERRSYIRVSILLLGLFSFISFIGVEPIVSKVLNTIEKRKQDIFTTEMLKSILIMGFFLGLLLGIGILIYGNPIPIWAWLLVLIYGGIIGLFHGLLMIIVLFLILLWVLGYVVSFQVQIRLIKLVLRLTSRKININVDLLKMPPFKTVESISFSWEKTKKGLTSGLIYGMIVGAISGLFFFAMIIAQRYDLNYLLSNSLGFIIIEPIFGLVFGLLFGLLNGLTTGFVGPAIRTKRIPNQSIFKSARNATFLGLFIGASFGLIFMLIFEILGQYSSLNPELVGLIFGLISGLLAALLGGGMACLQHFCLRFALYRNSRIPWNYARFLDYATERMLLQRVGGRYRFIHKLLQDHFAQMPLDTFR